MDKPSLNKPLPPHPSSYFTSSVHRNLGKYKIEIHPSGGEKSRHSRGRLLKQTPIIPNLSKLSDNIGHTDSAEYHAGNYKSIIHAMSPIVPSFVPDIYYINSPSFEMIARITDVTDNNFYPAPLKISGTGETEAETISLPAGDGTHSCTKPLSLQIPFYTRRPDIQCRPSDGGHEALPSIFMASSAAEPKANVSETRSPVLSGARCSCAISSEADGGGK